MAAGHPDLLHHIGRIMLTFERTAVCYSVRLPDADMRALLAMENGANYMADDLFSVLIVFPGIDDVEYNELSDVIQLRIRADYDIAALLDKIGEIIERYLHRCHVAAA